MFECLQILNRQRNLNFTNVPEECQPLAAMRVKVIRVTLRALFRTLDICNPFPYMKMHVRLGVYTGTLPGSVVVVLSKYEQHMLSNLSHIGIVPDMPCL